MIFYNSLLAKWFLGKGKKHYFMLGWFFFNPDTSTYFIVTVFMVVDGVTIRDLSHTLLV